MGHTLDVGIFHGGCDGDETSRRHTMEIMIEPIESDIIIKTTNV